MSAPALAAPGGRVLVIRGRPYPVLLPTLRDPRLHLAAVIISLQVLGQAAFDFRVSIAQIIISLGTCAVLEVGIAFRQQRVIMWPASALITGNGVAFILRVPGTEHGQWWSLRGWWIFAATSAVSLLSKYVIRSRGQHIFNPSNIGLVLCFIVLGSGRAEPLDFWWARMSPWMALALAIIVTGGLAILSRLHLLAIAVAFWLAFAAGIGALAASGHAMTARWHLGPITGGYFWWVLVTSPEILVFLFFMITDPKTIPSGRRARLLFAVGVGLLAALLIAPARTEFWSKVAVLGALAVVCLARPVLESFVPAIRLSTRRLAVVGIAGLAAYGGLLVTAGIPARSTSVAAAPLPTGRLPAITILPSHGVQSQLTLATAQQIARGLVADKGVYLHVGGTVRIWLEAGKGQGSPLAVVQLDGRTYRLSQSASWWTVVSGPAAPPAPPSPDYHLVNVAAQVGLDFRQGAFRFGMSPDLEAMSGGGLCWLDYNNDGWLDLFVVNSYADANIPQWQTHGGYPHSSLFENVKGRFVEVSAKAHAALAVRGNGCVAGDLNGDGYPDLYVTTGVDDKLLWNNGDGTFTEGARAAGVVSFGWHSGAAIGDVNHDGRPDLFVAGYTDPYAPIAGSAAGFPNNDAGVRDLLFLNEGNGPDGRAHFREVGRQVGIDPAPYDHSLGAVLYDFNGDGRLDLYVANDGDPNRLYLNEPSGPLGFHFVEAAARFGIGDKNAGMGIAVGDYSGDGRPDILISNSRGQTHAVFQSQGASFVDGRPSFVRAFGSNLTGWGDSWVDLSNNGKLDLVLANGAVPMTSLAKDAGPVQVLENLTTPGQGEHFAAAGASTGINAIPRVNGRGLAAADYDNDGRVDIAVNSIGGPLLLLRNVGHAGHWLEVQVEPFSPGAAVTVVGEDGLRQVRNVQAGSSYLSSEDPRVHFGLGLHRRAREVIVRYPDGTIRRLRDVDADRILVVRR